MIILNMKDGLGNQFFEYAFAKYLQKKCDDRICINNYFFQNGKRRAYSLHHFCVDEQVEVFGKAKEYWYTLCFNARLFTCYPDVFLKWIFSKKRPKSDEEFRISSGKGMYVHFNTFHLFDVPASKRKNKHIYGNYEHYGYVKDVLPELRKEFKVKTEPSAENKAMIEKLRSEESVCVHIRRGDYLSPQWRMLHVCTFDYYQKALDIIQQRNPNAKFYVFSNTHDDIEWIKENYHFKQEVDYVDLGNTDYEEFRLMCNCKHFAISNSTFSWWAAVLSERENKTVVAPSPWVRDSSPDWEGLYLPGWQIVPVELEKEKG